MAKILTTDRDRLAGRVRRSKRLDVGDYEVLLTVIDGALDGEEARLAAVAGKRVVK